jgi:hypothetical protein
MLSIITALLPLVSNLTPVFIQLISHIKAQGGKSTEEIFNDAGIALDENTKKLLEDLRRLGV